RKRGKFPHRRTPGPAPDGAICFEGRIAEPRTDGAATRRRGAGRGGPGRPARQPPKRGRGPGKGGRGTGPRRVVLPAGKKPPGDSARRKVRPRAKCRKLRVFGDAERPPTPPAARKGPHPTTGCRARPPGRGRPRTDRR